VPRLPRFAAEEDIEMQANVGGMDRKVRLVAGTALLGAAALAPVGRRWRAVMGIGGAAALGSGLTGYCPASAALGIDTADSGQVDWERADFSQLPQIETGASAAGVVSG
jgi:hypothetical protein